jgi:beta-galactosidase
MIYYVGAYLDDAAQAAFFTKVIQVSGLNKVLETPPGVTATRRTNSDRKEFLFVINHTRQEQSIKLGVDTYDDLLSGKRYAAQMKLPALGVAILYKTF